MKKIFFISLYCCGVLLLHAQVKNDKDYREHSKEIAAEIWGTKSPEFAITKVSDEYKNESAVIIAKTVSMVNTAKKKRSFWGGQVSDKLTYDNSVHLRVKINDKAALNEFSYIEYEKQLVRNTRLGWGPKMYNQQYTFVGAKVIKPNGEEMIVNGDEEVLTVNEDKKKKGKLAISGLQVGDILDYYVREEVVTEMGNDIQGPYTYFLNTDYPVLTFKLHMELDERAGAIYVSANGAPKPKISKNDNGPVVDLELKNLTKATDSKWVIPMRQLPYVSIEYKVLSGKGEDKASDFDRGEVHEAEGWETFFSKLKTQYVRAFNSYLVGPAPVYWERAKSFFGGKKELRRTGEDSLVKVLYNMMLLQAAVSADNISELQNNIDGMSVFNFSIALDRSDLPHEFLFVTPRYGPSKNNILIGGNPLEPILHIKGEKDIWIVFSRAVFFNNKIPFWLEGETAEGFSIKQGWKDVQYKLPVSTAADNVISEQMEISLQPSNLQLLQVNRKTKLTGNYIEGTMADLETIEAYKEALRSTMKNGETISPKNEDSKNIENQQKEFKSEIEEWFNQEPKELIAYKIEGLTADAFNYASTFTMDNWVKKAGNNYIIEAGRFIGDATKLDEDERKRTLDIHLQFARTVQYSYSLSIPPGFTVKGIENFNKQVKNDVGEFSGSASISGDKVEFSVKRIMNKNYQPVANWTKMLELTDAVYDFTQQKLLLEKNK